MKNGTATAVSDTICPDYAHPNNGTMSDRTFARTRYPIFAACLCLAVCACTSGTAAPTSDMTGPDLADRLCVNSHMPVDDCDASRARRVVEMDWLSDAGIRCVRLDFRWWRIEPAPEQFNFADYDRVIDELSARGVTTIALVSAAPDWARPGGDSTIDPAIFGRLMRVLGQHFAGRIQLWELWNEPNWIFWEPEPDLHAYARLAVSGATALREVSASAIILSAGMLSLADLLRGEAVWQSVDTTLTAAPALAGLLNGIALHPYTWLQTWRPERSEGPERPSIAEMFDAAATVTANHHVGHLPLYDTETGWSTHLVGETDKARYLVRAALIALASGAARFTAFNLSGADPAESVPAAAETGYGLLRWDPDPLDSDIPAPEPAGIAFARLARLLQQCWLIHDSAWTWIPRGDGLFSVTCRSADRLVRFLWTSEPERTVTVAVPTPSGFAPVSATTLVSVTPANVIARQALVGDDPLILEYRSR
ncbi:MAG: hypothetical protein D6761_10275 [Candidatus Dadabacteria bacterium]|nr:MAG: hypothetical protein D6761_10275 [Candidatus Dadabacteria bacterium]